MGSTGTRMPTKIHVIEPTKKRHGNTIVPRQLNTAGYSRVSTELEAQQNSFKTQVDYYTNLINSNPEWKLVKIYADEGISGTQARKRDGFLDMIEDCKKGKIDLIITKSIPRFARNTVESLKYVRMLKAMNIGVIFENENINTLEMDNETTLAIYSTMAQAESETISANITWSVRKGFENGKVRYNFRSWYGYEKDENGQPRIVPREAEVIKEIYSRYLAGSSMKEIANLLNERGVQRKSGEGVWQAANIQSILKNERYSGDALCQKTYTVSPLTHESRINNGVLPQYLVENAHDAIIDRDTYQRAKAEMLRRSAKSKVVVDDGPQKGKYSGKYALSELLICGECGTAYKRATWKKRGKTKHVWRCALRLKHGTQYCKHSPTLNEVQLHHAINQAIMKYSSTADTLLHLLKQNIEMAAAELSGTEDIVQLKHRRATLQASMHELVELAAQSDDLEQYDVQFGAIAHELGEINKQILELEQNLTGQDTAASQLAEANEMLANAPLLLETFDNVLARKILDTIKVLDHETLEITFKNGEVIRQAL